MRKTLLWWSHDPDPNYARNRVVRQQLRALGWRIVDFRPLISGLGDVQARVAGPPPHAVVWVPCFRQRDVAAAVRHARRAGVPLIFDPLISAWDKQVFERRKFPEDSAAARRLLAWEGDLLRRCDRVVADTPAHAAFFQERFGLAADALAVVPVGAEEALFLPTPPPVAAPPEVLFAGSFIALQGPEVIVEAVRRYRGPPARFTLLGDGPLKAACMSAAQGLDQLRFEPWLDYAALPARLARARVLLGIFGSSGKAGRVIPNKAYQALACGRPLITREAPAWEGVAPGRDSGVWRVAAGDPQALAEALADVLAQPALLDAMSIAARATYERLYSERHVRAALAALLDGLHPGTTTPPGTARAGAAGSIDGV